MSNEEIIRKWKADDRNDTTKDTSTPGNAEKEPANPAGDAELDDATLERIAGGSSEWFLSLGCCPADGGGIVG